MTPLEYRPEVDGLRGIAVGAVVLYHLDPSYLPGGFAGVDVFFVLSGYLITSLLAAEWNANRRIDLLGFYARRVRRLMPALVIVIASVLAIATFLLGPLGDPFMPVLHSAMASLVFVANEYFLSTSGGYFAGPADQLPLLHLWSLAVEEQFYLVFPVLLWALLARGMRVAQGGLLLLSLTSLLIAEHWLQVAPDRAFFRTPGRFWELAAGALVALAPLASPWWARHSASLAALGLALVAAALVVTGWIGRFPGIGALPAVLGTALVLWAGHLSRDLGVAGRLLSARPVVRLGLWSYALYLWHWPLLAIDRAARLSPSPLAWRVALCLLALGLAAFTYRYVEQPVRRRLRVPPRAVLLAGLGSVALLFAVTGGLGKLSLVPPDRIALAERTRADRPADMVECHYALGAAVNGLAPTACRLPPGSVRRLAIWGDSHALAWRPFAEALARANGQQTLPITMDACLPLVGPSSPHPRSPRHGESCDRRNRLAMQALAVPGAFEGVVLVARWPGHGQSPAELLRLRARIDATLKRLSGMSEVIIIAAVPELPHPAAVCIASGRMDECAVPRARFDSLTAPMRTMLAELAAGRPNVTVVDPSAFFCDASRCQVLRDGYALFWDDDHVSSTAARRFAQSYLANPARYTLAPIPPSSPGH